MRNTCKACHQCPTHTRECLSFHIRSIIQSLSSCNGSFPCLKNSGVSIQFTSISRRLIANSPSKYSRTNVAHHTQIGYTYKNVWSNTLSPMYSILKKIQVLQKIVFCNYSVNSTNTIHIHALPSHLQYDTIKGHSLGGLFNRAKLESGICHHFKTSTGNHGHHYKN